MDVANMNVTELLSKLNKPLKLIAALCHSDGFCRTQTQTTGICASKHQYIVQWSPCMVSNNLSKDM